MAEPKLTLGRVEKAIGEKAEAWKGRCFEIASRIVDEGLVDGTAVYGHWLGPVSPCSMFYVKAVSTRASLGSFVQHGWVAIRGRSDLVFDPTRWVFEAVRPYLFYGDTGGLYDEGGNRLRRMLRGDPPLWDPKDRVVEGVESRVGTHVWFFVVRYLQLHRSLSDVTYVPGSLTRRQLHWLANASLEELGEHAVRVYDALCGMGCEALIPIDNFRRVRERRWGK